MWNTNQIVIAGKKKWTKTHAQMKWIVDSFREGNASFCKNVVMGQGDWLRTLKKTESPTCPVCRKVLDVVRR